MTGSATGGRLAFLEQYRWLPFLLPMAVFMLGTELERRLAGPAPTANSAQAAPAAEAPPAPDAQAAAAPSSRSLYPLVYTLKIAAVVAVLAWVWPAYRVFPLRVSPLAFVVGLVGVVLWVGLCKLRLEAQWLPKLGLGAFVDQGARTGFNPLAEMADRPLLAYGFLAVRFVGLAAVVPLVEEMFLRGWLMRFVTRGDWWNVGFHEIAPLGLALGTLVPMAMHPGELVAAAAWFSLVTGLMLYTRNLWDCIAAHAMTNLLLGVYVVATGSWELW